MMRKHIERIAMIACVTVIWTMGSVAAPDIEFAGGQSFDFGDVRAETTLDHTFTFTNPGDQVLQILQVKGG